MTSKMLEEAQSSCEAVERQLFNLDPFLVDLARELHTLGIGLIVALLLPVVLVPVAACSSAVSSISCRCPGVSRCRPKARRLTLPVKAPPASRKCNLATTMTA